MRLEPLFDQEMEQIKQEYEQRIKTYEEERRLLEQRIQEQIEQQRRTYEEERRLLEQRIQEQIEQQSQTYEQRIQEQIQQQSQTYEQRILQEHRATIESLLQFRFGSIDEELAAIIEPFAALPSAEYLALIPQLSNLSREELLTRFRQ